MDIAQYRQSPAEVERVAALIALVPGGPLTVLDVGARDGHLSVRLAERGAVVTALDLESPAVTHPRITCVKGDVTALRFPDRSFDVVLCAEVLEHLRPEILASACSELARVARRHLIVGVPYKQDTRVGRTRCARCGGRNPPWGHVNRFDRPRVERLFPDLTIDKVELVGSTYLSTNALSSRLMDLAGNPFGTYDQDEPCIHCGARLEVPPPSTALQKVFGRLAAALDGVQQRLTRVRPNWIHVRLAAGGTE